MYGRKAYNAAAYSNFVEASGGAAPTLKLFRKSNLDGLGAGGAFFADMLGLFLLVMVLS